MEPKAEGIFSMKPYYYGFRGLICILLLPFFAYSQLSNTERNLCEDKSSGYADRVAELIRNESYGDISGVLFLWEQECGMSEPLFRARSLQLISERKFPGVLDDLNMLDYAVAFEIRNNLATKSDQKEIDDYYQLYEGYFGFVPINSDFDRQTKQWARRLKTDVPEGSFPFLFLQLYEGQPEDFFKALNDGFFENTNLGRQYQQKLKENINLPEFNLGVSAGVWIPSGDLSILGNHPSIGIVLGAKARNTYLDLVFEFRFGKAANDINITVKDSLITTRNFQGGYLGLELTKPLIKTGSASWEVFIGGGYDLIDLVEDALDPEKQTYGTFAAHMGLGYRYQFRNRTWLSVKPGYYFLNHEHTKGSSLSGNAFDIRFTFGFSENARKSANLKRLQYW